MPGVRALLALFALPSLVAACGSDPSAEPKEGDRPDDPEIPDYTRSPCYGDSRATSVYDAETHGTRPVSATCRAEGERTLVYVADEIWDVPSASGAPGMSQDAIDAFMVAYELRGRENSFQPGLGVLPLDELVFGALDASTLPGGKLPVFVVDSGGAGEGYLCSWCDGTEFHLDGPLLGSLDSDEALSIAAHETVHVIHRALDANETFWVDETLAQAAMTVNGFFTDGEWLDDFLRATNVAWGPGLDDPLAYHYGAGLLFGSYLWERGGRSLLHAITSEPSNDWAGIDAALAATGDSSDAWNVYLDMGLAAFLDDPRTGYSFDSFDLQGRILPHSVATGTSYSVNLQPYGLAFVVFDADARSITLDSTTMVSSRLALGGTSAEVVELVPGEPFDVDLTPRVLLVTAPRAASFTVIID
jgi:hypothetical protein